MHGDDRRGSVVLLHGMARSARSMRPVARVLDAAGFQVSAVDYPTGPYNVSGLVERYVAPAIAKRPADQPIHVVTHSLGGILIRAYLQNRDLPTGSRIVMLAPPNHGSEVADRVRRWAPYRWWMGAVGQQLGTGPDGIARQLRPVDAEVGIIAARRSLQPWFSLLLPGPDDGAVSVASTRLPEMQDFLVVDASHSLVMFDRRVQQEVLHFLLHGRFRRRAG
jgi:pimeloyl-ACP methyl ester carboxylesterase